MTVLLRRHRSIRPTVRTPTIRLKKGPNRLVEYLKVSEAKVWVESGSVLIRRTKCLEFMKTRFFLP